MAIAREDLVMGEEKLARLEEMAYLEGTAREEVWYAPDEEKDSVVNIFTLLLTTFGETRSNAQLKRVVRERAEKQGKCEGIFQGPVSNI